MGIAAEAQGSHSVQESCHGNKAEFALPQAPFPGIRLNNGPSHIWEEGKGSHTKSALLWSPQPPGMGPPVSVCIALPWPPILRHHRMRWNVRRRTERYGRPLVVPILYLDLVWIIFFNLHYMHNRNQFALQLRIKMKNKDKIGGGEKYLKVIFFLTQVQWQIVSPFSLKID